jgi:putative oxidoreductase
MELGKAMGTLGIHFLPVYWGFMAAFAEFAGGIFLITGMLFRPACLFLFIDMVVATSMHFGMKQGLGIASHAIEDGIVFLSLILIGPGKISIDYLVRRRFFKT